MHLNRFLALVLVAALAIPSAALAETPGGGSGSTETSTSTSTSDSTSGSASGTTSGEPSTSEASASGQVQLSAEAQARVDALNMAVEKLEAALASIPAEAKVQVEAAVAALKEQASAEASGKATAVSEAVIKAAADLQALAASGTLSPELKEQAEALVADLKAKLNIDTSETGSGTGTGSADTRSGTGTGTGGESRGWIGSNFAKEAHAKVVTHLQGLLDSGVITNENAQGNIQAVIEKLVAEAKANEGAQTEAEALAEVEAALEAKAEKHSAAELDVLAEVQTRQGKKAEALATLEARLEANPRTMAAYEAFVKLDAEAGTKKDLDTFVAGKKVNFDVRPMIKEGRTLMPIRALVEALGASVRWDAETRTVTVLKGTMTILLQIDSKVAVVNGVETQLDVPAQIEGGRTLIPARFVSEGLGLFVSWMAETTTIVVTEEPVE